MNKGITDKFDPSRPMNAWPDFCEKEIIQSNRKYFGSICDLYKPLTNGRRRICFGAFPGRGDTFSCNGGPGGQREYRVQRKQVR